MAEIEIVTKRNELRGLFRRLNARDARNRENISLRDSIL